MDRDELLQHLKDDGQLGEREDVEVWMIRNMLASDNKVLLHECVSMMAVGAAADRLSKSMEEAKARGDASAVEALDQAIDVLLDSIDS